MAQIRNTSGQQLVLPWLGDRLVQNGQTVEVPDDLVYAYTQQSIWQPVGAETEDLHEAAAIVAGADQLITNGGPLDEPDGNASRVEWGAFVVATHLAEASDLTDLSRDEIRDEYALPTGADEVPGGNATRDEWAAYAVASGQATPDEVVGKGRNELRDIYAPHEGDQTPAETGGDTEATPADDTQED